MILWVPQYSEPRWKSYVVETTRPVLTPQQCDELIRIGQSGPQVKGEISKPETTQEYRKSTISWIPINKQEAVPTYQIIKKWIEATNNNHFGFNAMQMTEHGQYAEYAKGDFYDWHMDSSVEMSDMPPVRKISMTLLLNDPDEFEGGNLELFCGDRLNSKKNKFKLKRGFAVFFASFILHRVAPVTKGNRKSLVMWFGGPPLK
jgi:PKHD-type hydroxylase